MCKIMATSLFTWRQLSCPGLCGFVTWPTGPAPKPGLSSSSSPRPQEGTGLGVPKSCRTGSSAGFPPAFRWPISQWTSVYFIAKAVKGLGPLQATASYCFSSCLSLNTLRPPLRFWGPSSCSKGDAAVTCHQVGLAWTPSASTLGFRHLRPLVWTLVHNSY